MRHAFIAVWSASNADYVQCIAEMFALLSFQLLRDRYNDEVVDYEEALREELQKLYEKAHISVSTSLLSYIFNILVLWLLLKTYTTTCFKLTLLLMF